MTTRLGFLLVLLMVGCAKKPTASEVCAKIEATGVAKNCHAGTPGGLGAAAVERVEFDLPSVPAEGGGFKGGSVLRFDRESFYESTEEAYGRMATLAGPHRYGSKKALIFVQMNEGLAADKGSTVKKLVESL